MSKKLCESLLKAGMVSSETVEYNDRFELLIDDMLGSLSKETECNINNVKKRLGKMLSY